MERSPLRARPADVSKHFRCRCLVNPGVGLLAFDDLEKAGIEVVGVSPDSPVSHEKFAGKYSLAFTLLADEDKEVVRAYGVWGKKKFMGREFMGTHRRSFLIDPRGKVARVYEKVKPDAHAAEVLADRRRLGKGKGS